MTTAARVAGLVRAACIGSMVGILGQPLGLTVFGRLAVGTALIIFLGCQDIIRREDK